jgi:hypothetical protein
MNEKNVGPLRNYNQEQFHLGLAAVQKNSLLDQLRRNESKNVSLLKTDRHRASLKDVNSVPEVNFLGNYLSTMTYDQKPDPKLFETISLNSTFQRSSRKFSLPSVDSSRFGSSILQSQLKTDRFIQPRKSEFLSHGGGSTLEPITELL